MEIFPIAHFRSPLKSKFGIPRQSGLVGELAGSIVFEPDYRHEEALRGLEDFDYLWLVWEFSANRAHKGAAHKGSDPAVRPASHEGLTPCEPKDSLTVRPPRLGGNRRLGVFATRSPFRPNPLGLSCVRLDRIERDAKLGPVIHVLGADLMDGTPIYDIKPYVAYADSHPGARSGFVDQTEWRELQVEIPDAVANRLPAGELPALRRLLALDPRPRYHDDAGRVYGMPFGCWDVRFRVSDGVVTVVDCVETVAP